MHWVRADEHHSIDPDELEASIDDATSVVCLSQVEYGTGQQYDLKRWCLRQPARSARQISPQHRLCGLGRLMQRPYIRAALPGKIICTSQTKRVA